MIIGSKELVKNSIWFTPHVLTTENDHRIYRTNCFIHKLIDSHRSNCSGTETFSLEITPQDIPKPRMLRAGNEIVSFEKISQTPTLISTTKARDQIPNSTEFPQNFHSFLEKFSLKLCTQIFQVSVQHYISASYSPL